MVRKLKDNEKKWIISLEKCLKKMPKSILLFADGKLNIVDTEEHNYNFGSVARFQQDQKPFQPLCMIDFFCGAGDPWS